MGILDNSQIKPMLLNVHYPYVANSKAIEEIVLDNCKLLWPQDNRYPCLHLIISDQAQYMISAVRMMKLSRVVFPNIHHITCIVHAIDLVCKQISDDLAVLNDFMVEEKKFFCLSGKRKRLFISKTKLSLPPSPVMTRWGTWIKCADYYIKNFEIIKNFFLETDIVSSTGPIKSLEKIKELLLKVSVNGRNDLETDLMTAHQFIEIPSLMKKLESESMSVSDQKSLLWKVQKIIKESRYNTTLVESLRKNPDIDHFFSANLPLNLKLNRSFCPLNSCSVERSFSIYKSFLRKNRLSFLPCNIRDNMIVKYNNLI